MEGKAKLERWAHLSEIVASVAVVVTLLFLALEVRANTQALERQSFLQRANRVYEPFFDSDAMPSVYAKVGTVDGLSPWVQATMDQYDMSLEEATLWTRHLGWIWAGFLGDFRFNGPSELLALQVRGMLSSPDNQLYWDRRRETLPEDFVAYVEGIREGL